MTPPFVQNRSSDRLAGLGHSRNSSTDLLQRPNSRGPSAAFAPAGNGDMPTTLSAREQEHIARVTGQPLINMAGLKKQAAPGLVGAIETRELENQQMKQRINSQAVQHAIAQRQQHAMHPQYPEQPHYGTQQPQVPFGGQFPHTGPSGAHQPWTSPATNVYAQVGGFSAPMSPTSVYGGSPEVGMQSPPVPMSGIPYSPAQHQQFFAMPQRPAQGQGRGGQQGRQY